MSSQAHDEHENEDGQISHKVPMVIATVLALLALAIFGFAVYSNRSETSHSESPKTTQPAVPVASAVKPASVCHPPFSSNEDGEMEAPALSADGDPSKDASWEGVPIKRIPFCMHASFKESIAMDGLALRCKDETTGAVKLSTEPGACDNPGAFQVASMSGSNQTVHYRFTHP